MSEKLWGGRFSKTTDEMINEFQASIGFDRRMYREDIAGSLAHAAMLAKVGILSEEDHAAIEKGLKDILAQIEHGDFDFSVALEDIHMNIEKRLTDAIGDAGSRLHTARSRNDQVALDTHLFVRHAVVDVMAHIRALQQALTESAAQYRDVIMPGYTHLQRAQPILFSHHLMAYFGMLARDFERFQGVYAHTDIMPLGAGALAGTTLPIDRAFVAKKLNFERIYANSMDAVSDRDYIMEFLSAASILMVHLSRLSEEIILWCSREFSFIELDDAHCTGSSMMPQKKNPDVPELVRGKTGRVYGHLMALLTLMKGQPLAYNKDNQEDKEPLFDTVDTLVATLRLFADMTTGIQVRAERMRQAAAEGFSTATDLADYLVKRGLPFRDAHELVAQAVREASDAGVDLAGLGRERLKALSPLVGDDVLETLTLEGSVNARNHIGGTAPAQVRAAIARHRARLASA